jgi:hypothetical protein
MAWPPKDLTLSGFLIIWKEELDGRTVEDFQAHLWGVHEQFGMYLPEPEAQSAIHSQTWVTLNRRMSDFHQSRRTFPWNLHRTIAEASVRRGTFARSVSVTCDLELTIPLKLRSKFSGIWLETWLSNLGQLLQEASDLSDHSSIGLCHGESLPKSPIGRALLLEFDKMLDMMDADKMSISLFMKFSRALTARIVTLHDPW